MTEIRYHRHRVNDLIWTQHHDPCDPATATPLVMLDPADLPKGFGSPQQLRLYSHELDDGARWTTPARLLDYLADQIEQQTSPPVAEPVGLGAVVLAHAGSGNREPVVRAGLPSERRPWVDRDGDWHSWADLRDVEVLAEGWTGSE